MEAQERSIAEGASSVEDLFKRVETGSLVARYLRLLHRAATDGYPVGVQESTEWEAEALSDWDAAACVPKTENGAGYEIDVTTGDIREARGKLGDAVEARGSRKGDTAYTLNSAYL